MPASGATRVGLYPTYNLYMCSRFVMNHAPQLLQNWYAAAHIPQMQARYNIAPGNPVHVILAAPAGPEFALMRWGFIPSWAEDPACVPMLHNARGETVAEKPMFRQAFRLRRCLIPASGFYEWKSVSGQKWKQPYYLSLADGTPMSFAGLWDCAITASGERIETCAIVTTKANGLIEPIYHRMPVLLDRESWPLWLGADSTVPDLLALLQPYPAAHMQAWEVADAVNRALNDEPDLLLPLAGKNGGTGAHPAVL